MSALRSKQIQEYLLKFFNMDEPIYFSKFLNKNQYTNFTDLCNNWNIDSQCIWLQCLLQVEYDIKKKCLDRNIVRCLHKGIYEYIEGERIDYNFRINTTRWTNIMYENYCLRMTPTREFFYFILLTAYNLHKNY
jgi:hypothetical protein